jgi:hypothetical protein
MEFIAEAKRNAIVQEEYAWLAQLHKYELRAIKMIFEGDERTDRVIAVSYEAMENGKFVSLEAEIAYQSALYLEKGRNALLSTGKFDTELGTKYLQSKFCRQRIDSWPVSFQIQKLRIDEAIHYFLGDPAQAAVCAEKLLLLAKRLEAIRQRNSEDHVKCLFRLVAYCTEVGNQQRVVAILDEFRRCVSVESDYKHLYLLRLPATLLRTSFVFALPELAIEGVELWNASGLSIEANLVDAVRFETMIYICAYFLSIRKIADAREVLNRLTDVERRFPYLALQTVVKILHLMILLEEDDEIGLQSFSKNYKRHLNACLKGSPDSSIALAGLEVIMILSRESNLESKEKLQVSLTRLLDRLQAYQETTAVTLKPWSYAIRKWAELNLQS